MAVSIRWLVSCPAEVAVSATSCTNAAGNSAAEYSIDMWFILRTVRCSRWSETKNEEFRRESRRGIPCRQTEVFRHMLNSRLTARPSGGGKQLGRLAAEAVGDEADPFVHRGIRTRQTAGQRRERN